MINKRIQIKNVNSIITVLISAFVVVLALFVSAILILVMGLNPVLAIKSLFIGGFGTPYSISETLVKTAPLICTGLSFAIAHKCGLLNIGAEGQLLIGGMCGGVVAINLEGLPFSVHITLSLLVSMIFGGLWGLIAGILKTRFDANEIITTIMLNYIALFFLNYMVPGPLQDPTTTNTQSSRILATAQFPSLMHGARLHGGILVAFTLAFLFFLFLKYTKRGYIIRLVGSNRNAALYAGINSGSNIRLAMFLAGAFAGAGGAMEILGTQFRIFQSFSADLGFDGIAVSVLGQNSAAGIMLSAILFGMLKSGSSLMKMNAGVPSSMVQVMQGLVIIFVISSRCITIFLRRKRLKNQSLLDEQISITVD